MNKIRVIITLLCISMAFVSCGDDTVVDNSPEEFFGGKIEGVIIDAISGNAIRNANITTQSTSHSVITNSQGYYEMENLIAANYILFAEKLGYIKDTVSVLVDSSRITRADFTLVPVPKPGSIEGKVYDSKTLNIIRGVIVTTSPFTTTVITNNTGAFAIYGLSEGSYTVTVDKQDYISQSANIKVSDDDTTSIDFYLKYKFGVIYGYVTDNTTNMPIEEVIITTDPPSMADVTDVNGYFMLNKVNKNAYNTYQITAQKSNTHKTNTVTIAFNDVDSVMANISLMSLSGSN